MDRLKQFLALAFLISISPTQAQYTMPTLNIASATSETIYMHVNTNVLLTGESLYCKLYCVNPVDKKPSAISRIAYAEIVDSNRKSVVQYKFNLENGLAEGSFFIPTTLASGNYKLAAYTQWMLNASAVNFFETDISIINPFQPMEKTAVENTVDIKQEQDSGNTSIVSIATDKKMYAPREKATLRLGKLVAENGNYSVSIRKTGQFPSKPLPSAKHFNPVSFAQKPLSQTALPELRGEMIWGKLTSKKENKNLEDKTVALSIPGKSYAFKLVKTDKDGQFEFILDKNPTGTKAVIQVMESDREDYGIVLEESISPDFSGLRFEPAIAITPELKTEIETRSIASQIENAYYDIKKDSLKPAPATVPFFHTLEKRYVLDGYTRFPTMRETITEVVLEMYTKKSGGKSSAQVRNNSMETDMFGSPLVLVDGLLLQDTNELYDYNPENIYAIDVINNPYIYGPKTFSGIASIETKNTDYETRASGDYFKKVDLKRPLPKKINFSPDYSTDRYNRIPDYRYQLLWTPNVILDANDKQFEFYTSDVAGRFEIAIEGFTDNGQPVSVRDFIEVK